MNSKRAEQGKQSLLGSLFVYIGVFRDDFAAVDFREELCYHSRPKKQIRRAGKGIIQNGQSCQRNRGQKIIRTSDLLRGSDYSGVVTLPGIEPGIEP